MKLVYHRFYWIVLLILVGGCLTANLLICRPQRLEARYGGLNPLSPANQDYIEWDPLVRFEPRIEPYLPVIRLTVNGADLDHPVDPLLALALIRRESSFDSRTISRAGAAGPMQLMPETARSLGLTRVYIDENFERGRELQQQAHSRLNSALAALRNQEFVRAQEETLQWREKADRAEVLMKKYRDDLSAMIEGKTQQELDQIDQRFVIDRAVPAGISYLASMLDQRNGDIREALAAYNAGPGNVRRYEGIPPFVETVNFQNRVINSFRKYREIIFQDQGSLDSYE